MTLAKSKFSNIECGKLERNLGKLITVPHQYNKLCSLKDLISKNETTNHRWGKAFKTQIRQKSCIKNITNSSNPK